MTVTEVAKAIQNKPEITSKELTELLDLSIGSVNRAIRSLIKDVTENIKYRELTQEEKIERYGKYCNVSVRVFWME